MSFQGKKSIPRITVSPAASPPSPHAPCPPPRGDCPGSAPSALPSGSSPGACFCPAAGASRRVPSRAAGGRVFCERLPGPLSRAGRTGPRPCRLPGTSSAPGEGAGPGEACSAKRRGASLPAVDGRRGGRTWSRGSARGLAGRRGLLLAPPARPRGADAVPRAAPLASSGPRVRRAGSSLSETKRLSPEPLEARTPLLNPGSETPGEASAHWSRLSGHSGSPRPRKERHPPPNNHMHGCGWSDGPSRAAGKQSRPFQKPGGGREGGAPAPAGRGQGAPAGLRPESGADLSRRVVGLPGSLPERCSGKKDPLHSRSGGVPASRLAQGPDDAGSLPSGKHRFGCGWDRHKASGLREIAAWSDEHSTASQLHFPLGSKPRTVSKV